MKRPRGHATWLLLAATLWASTPSLAAKILVVRKGSPDFTSVLDAVAAEVGKAHQIADMPIDAELDYEGFSQHVRAAKPDLLVLMDNQAVNLALRFNQEADAYARSLRGIATMGLNLKKVLSGNPRIAGVAYEVPALSVVTQFRFVTGTPLRRVLTIYRQQEFGDTIAQAKTQLQREGIELVAIDADGVGADDLKDFLGEKLSGSHGGKKVDAIWVQSDNALLTAETFGQVWVEKSRQLKLPFLCGIEKFAAKELDFCSFAASPDARDLGHQVAEMIFAVLDEHRSPGELGIEYILGVKETVNLAKLKSCGLDVRADRLQNVTILK